MASDSGLQTAAARARRTADHARRLAELIHRAPLREELAKQACDLEREARELEGTDWSAERPADAISREALLQLISQGMDVKGLRAG